MNDCLLPYPFKWVGGALALLGLAGLVYYSWFDFQIMLPVFAIFSSFLETKYFSVIHTNAADELIMLSLLSGSFLLAFTKERRENEKLKPLREKAVGRAILSNTGLLFFSILFFYGKGFLTILLLNLFSFFIFYLAYF